MRKTSNLDASRTINYKDALTITGRLDVIQEFPLIPGVVTACGLALPKFESLLGTQHGERALRIAVRRDCW